VNASDPALANEHLRAEIEELRHELQLAQEALATTERAYASFVPKDFLNFLSVSDIRGVRLGMQAERHLTILFSDIRNFTGLSETMTPQENFDFLNSYLSQMEPEIVPFRGVVDKFIGDAVMALYPNSADDAIRSGLAMLARLEHYNRGRSRAGYNPVGIGIGINTGFVMLGTVGGTGRMDSTVIGDAVNLASRLEGMTKTFNVPLLISENTLYSLEEPERYCIRFVGRNRVRGKNEAVAIYEVFDGDALVLREAKVRTRKRFEEALAFFYTGDVSRARSRLQRCLQEAPGDEPARIYFERCEQFLRNNYADGVDTIELAQFWSDDYSSSIAEIDGQHRSMLGLMNNLTTAVREQRGSDALGLVRALREEASSHFEMEEGLMRDAKYIFTREHQQQHERLLLNLAQIESEIASGSENPTYLAFRIRVGLMDWLTNHSAKSDRHLGHHLLTRRI
jgi:hemerythrin